MAVQYRVPIFTTLTAAAATAEAIAAMQKSGLGREAAAGVSRGEGLIFRVAVRPGNAVGY
jgi:hypothetical protein